MENAIVCQGVEKEYDNFTLSLPNFHVEKGTVHGLVGANGSGKTTTLKLLLGLLKPSNGSVTVLGGNHIDDDQELRQNIGFIIEDASLPSMLNPIEIGKMMKGIYHRWDAALYMKMLKNFDLDPKKPFRKCSRGMKVKIQLAVALSHGAELLILDEPTSGLDPVAREEILELLGTFCMDENHTILISSHITSDLEKLCDYVTLLEQGSIRLSAEKDSLLESYRLVRIAAKHFEDIETNTIVGMKRNDFAIELLMKTDDIPSFATGQRVDLETLIIMMAKKGDWS